MKLYVFFRAEGFYPVEMKDDKDAIENALHNEGTLKVLDPSDNRVVWKAKEELKN